LNTLLADRRRTVAHGFIADGDHVVVEARGEMMTKAGVRYDNEYCLVYRLAHVPAKWNPVRRQGPAPTLESTAFSVHMGSPSDLI
jgi:hypothetical protein